MPPLDMQIEGRNEILPEWRQNRRRTGQGAKHTYEQILMPG
jgi:hypothetical protein